MKASSMVGIMLVCYMAACGNRTAQQSDGDAGGGASATVTSGTGASAGDPANGKLIDSVICQADPSQSYALYVPEIGSKAALPIIYFFDPHAKGSLPLQKYQALADRYGFILAGSNNSKNGNDWTITDNIWRTLYQDTRNRLKINVNRIYTAGFSGGAKVAGYIAIQNPEIKGVIAGGAGLPDGVSASDLSFSITAIAGTGDMNMTDLAAFNKELDKTRTTHRMIFFPGKHEWAPVNIMDKAFASLQFDAMQVAAIPQDQTLINRYATASKKEVDSCIKAGDWIGAWQECRLSINVLNLLTPEVNWFVAKEHGIAQNPAFLQQQDQQEKLFATEQDIKAQYMQQFQTGDLNYWTKTVNELNAGAKGNSPQSGMDQRLLAYLSLAFYSVSNHLITGKQDTEASRFVSLYKLADPGNPEAWYFSAILDARNGQGSAVRSDLERAISLGFNERDRLMRQPEFQSLSPQLDLKGIIAKMK